MIVWRDVFLGVIAVATLAIAIAQVGVIIAAGLMARRVGRIVDQRVRDVKPLFGHLIAIGSDASRAVAPMARAAVAAGADGLIIEVHNDPDHALSDGAQSMFPAQFDRLMAELRIIAPAIGRSICLEPVTRRGWGS